MKNEFVPYDIALSLKELEFDKDCFACYTKDKELSLDHSDNKGEGHYFQDCAAPLYQQAFRWFREEYKYRFYCYETNENGFKWVIEGLYSIPYAGSWFFTYEEAQDACLRKLIEIVKEKRDD